MPLTLANNTSGGFHDITASAVVNNYVTQQMVRLNAQDVGATVLQVFIQGAVGSPRLFGSNRDLARADVTRSGTSVLIQIQQNVLRPSPTYASLTVNSSVHGYLNLDGVPAALNTWTINITNIDRISPKEKINLVERINDLVARFNRTRTAALLIGMEGLPAVLMEVAVDTLAASVAGIQQSYNALRTELNNYRNIESVRRQTDVGTQVITGLNQSLTSIWTQTPNKVAGIGTKTSVTLSFT